MEKDYIFEAKELLREPPELKEIPIFRAASALDASLTLGQNHSFHYAEYHIYPVNLYFTFQGYATKDINDNYDSPIFQDSRYNYTKPLWQEIRERFEAKWGIKISHIFFGEYEKHPNGEEFFTVKNEPKDSHWIYIRKPEIDGVSIGKLTPEQITKHQAIVDEIRLNRAIATVIDRHEREESRVSREEAITALDSKYSSEFERFTFGPETFRFRQFFEEFYYTPKGLEAFDNFYERKCVPYRNDEIANAEWREKSKTLKERLVNDEEIGHEIRMNNVSNFKITRLPNGCCQVESDLIDDRTGKQFHLIIDSQRFDDILDEVISELVIVFQRKKQIRRAAETLHLLASGQ